MGETSPTGFVRSVPRLPRSTEKPVSGFFPVSVIFTMVILGHTFENSLNRKRGGGKGGDAPPNMKLEKAQGNGDFCLNWGGWVGINSGVSRHHQ